MLNTNNIVPSWNSDMRKLIFSVTVTLFSKIDFFRKAMYALSKYGVSGMLNTDNIVPSLNADMPKLIFAVTLTLFSKNRLVQKGHICPIETGVFGDAEFE